MTSKEGLTWFSAISKRMVLDIYTDVDYAGFVIDKKKNLWIQYVFWEKA